MAVVFLQMVGIPSLVLVGFLLLVVGRTGGKQRGGERDRSTGVAIATAIIAVLGWPIVFGSLEDEVDIASVAFALSYLFCVGCGAAGLVSQSSKL